jgi:hypothetical protein
MDEDCRCPEPGLFDALDIRGVEYVREVQDTGFEPYYEVTFGAGDTLCIDPATGRKFYSMRFGR